MTERRTAPPFNGRPTNAACYGTRVALWGVKDNRKVFEAAYGIVQVPFRLTVEFDAPYLACERSEYRLALYAGHGFAHASVDPEPESQVSGCLARDVKPVGVLPTTRVAVGRSEGHHHPLVLSDLDARELSIAGCGAEELLYRSLEAYRLLEYGPGTRRIGSQQIPLREIGCQVLTMGQYLRPTEKHLPVDRYWHPDEFAALEKAAYELGFESVAAGPLVRSSYQAEQTLERAAAR